MNRPGRHLLVLALASLIPSAVPAFELQWSRTTHTSPEDAVTDVALLAAGDIVVAGHRQARLCDGCHDLFSHVFLIRYRADGDESWRVVDLGREVWPPPSCGPNVAVDATDRILVSFCDLDGGNVVALTASGEPDWEIATTAHYPQALDVSVPGDVRVAEDFDIEQSVDAFRIIDAESGESRCDHWEWSLGAQNRDVVSVGGEAFVIGQIETRSSGEYTGAIVVTGYDDACHRAERTVVPLAGARGAHLLTLGDHSLVSLGEIGLANVDVHVTEYYVGGSLYPHWSAVIDLGGDEQLSAAASRGSIGTFVGTSEQRSRTAEAVIGRFTASDGVSWTTLHEDAQGAATRGVDIAVLASGDLLVLMQRHSRGGDTTVLARYDASGTLVDAVESAAIREPARMAWSDALEQVYVVGRGNGGIVTELYDLSTSNAVTLSAVPSASLHLDSARSGSAFRFTYTVPSAREVRASIYDVQGRHVRTLVDAHRAAGSHRAVWDGLDGHGRRVASGVYFARFDLGNRHEHRRLTVVR